MNKVHLIDCMEFMKGVPDKYYELAIVDPPYGIGADKAQNNAGRSREKANGKSKAGRGWKTYKETDWDNETPTDEYFEQLFRISKKQIIWGGNYFNFIWSYSNSFIVWDKKQRDFSLADGELAWYSEKDKAMRIFDYARGSALINNNENGGRIHPTQKPVALYEWLLKNYAKPGDKIFDSHVGSGSIRIACHDMGFDFEGCEIDKDYWEAQEKRYQQHISQMELFSPEGIQKAIYQEELF
jgi:site-specific DNA-methyltransferase (adenine-specific)